MITATTARDITMINTPYDTALLYKYAFSYDYKTNKNGTKRYIGFNTFIETVDFLNKTNQLQKRTYYEITKDEGKLFIDIDKADFTRDGLNTFLQRLIVEFNLFFKTDITIDDFLVYYRDDTTTDRINSIHIIGLKYKLTKLQIKYFCRFLFVKIPNSRTLIDITVYNRNKLFNLRNNTKLTYFECDEDARKANRKANEEATKADRLDDITEHTPNRKYFIDFKEQSDDPADYLISYTDNLTPLTTPKYHNGIAVLLNTLNKNLMKTAFNKWKNNTPAISSVLITKETIKFNEPMDLLETIILRLNNNFYNQSSEWKFLTSLFKKFNMTAEQFNLWNDTSIKKTTNTKWTRAENAEYYKGINTSKIRSGIPSFIKTVEKHIPNIKLELKNQNIEIAKWIKKYIPTAETDYIISLLDDGADERGNVDILNIYSYNLNSGFLYNNSIKKTISNYFIEITHKDDAKNNHNLNNVIEYDDIADIEAVVDKFNKSKELTELCVKAQWGAGKTHIIIKIIIEYATRYKRRVIVITENNSLNKQFVGAMTDEEKGIRFISHIDSTKSEMNKTKKNTQTTAGGGITNLVCSTESIHKIDFKDTDIIIIDESESILNHFESETFRGANANKFKLFKTAIQTAYKVVILDADISNERMEIFNSIRNTTIPIHYAKTSIFRDYKFNMFIGKNKADYYEKCIYDDIKANKRIAYGATTQKRLQVLYIQIKTDLKKYNKTLLRIDGTGAYLYKDGIETTYFNEHRDDEQTDILKTDIMVSLEKFITDHSVDVFLYSPTIKTGISINAPIFNKLYIYGYSSTVCSREFIQMFFRCRRLIDKEINILTNTGFYATKPKLSINEIKRYLTEPIKLLNTLEIFNECSIKDAFKRAGKKNGTDDGYNFIVDDDYFNTRAYNLLEKYNSIRAFNQDLTTKLLYNHNLKITYIDAPDEDEEVEEDDDGIDDKETPPNKMVEARLITYQEYKTSDFLTYEEIRKYKLINEFYYINGLSLTTDINESVYNSINTPLFYSIFNDRKLISRYIGIKKNLTKTINTIELDHRTDLDIYRDDENRLNGYEQNLNKRIMGLKVIKLLFNKDTIEDAPYYITNAELQKVLQTTGLIQDLNDFFKINNLDNKTVIPKITNVVECNETKGKRKTGNEILYSLNDLFDSLGLKIRYCNTNTTRPNDKMICHFTDFKKGKREQYNGRLEPTELNQRPHKDDIVKTRNTFKFNEVKAYPTEPVNKFILNENGIYEKVDKPNDYFTTYKLITNKHLNFIKNRVNNTTDVMRRNLMIFLINYLLKKNKPLIISQQEYTSKTNTFYKELDYRYVAENAKESKPAYNNMNRSNFVATFNKCIDVDNDIAVVNDVEVFNDDAILTVVAEIIDDLIDNVIRTVSVDEVVAVAVRVDEAVAVAVAPVINDDKTEKYNKRKKEGLMVRLDFLEKAGINIDEQQKIKTILNGQ